MFPQSQENKTYIFDLDGTIANCNHRLGYIKTKPKNWKAFFSGIPHDTVYENVRSDLLSLYGQPDTFVLIVTARPVNQAGDHTIAWLEKHGIKYNDIYFRPANDFRDDYIIKSEILDRIIGLRYNVVKVWDDRPKVIEMWRSRGLEVVDCGTGEEF